jgi:hypothetical protein
MPARRATPGRAARSAGRFGFAASEADGRFRHHAQAAIDEDFATLQRWLERMLGTPGG